MEVIINPPKNDWKLLIKRPVIQQESLFALVSEIFDDIRREGDAAVKKYNRIYDKASTEVLEVDQEVVAAGLTNVPDELRDAIKLAKKNIEIFHSAQHDIKMEIETAQGVKCWRESRPIDKIGIYIPGGSAPLFSTVLMLGVPAKLAGCKEIILCTPPNQIGLINPAILFAAQLVGVTKIYAVGGIQAIGAMALGTESIEKVDKIFGPGNQYVTAAKQLAQYFGVTIDMPAGPSELLIIADASCVPEFVAADLLSQAEHGSDSQVILLSDNIVVVENVMVELQRQIELLPRKDIAALALGNSKAIVLDSISACIDLSNDYAPEHLILAINNPHYYCKDIKHAGSVFLGNYSCESAGDYATGTNHTLPTNGYARSYSGVSLDSFIKKITFQELTPAGIKNIGPSIEIMAEAEQLVAHKNAVTVRLNKLSK